MGRTDRRAPSTDEAPEQSAANTPPGRTTAEWTTFAISLAITLALAGAALVEHVLLDEPPGTRLTVTVAADRATRQDDRYYVPFTVANDGAEPAENVVVLFEVKRGEETVEESTADVAFLPTSGSAEGELVTALDPAQHAIEARVATLQLP